MVLNVSSFDSGSSLRTSDKRNVSSEIVREDFNKRSKLIKYLADMNITNYTDLWAYLRRYSEEPEKISRELKEDKDERGNSHSTQSSAGISPRI